MKFLLFSSLLLVQYYLCSGRENCPNCDGSADCLEECAGGCSPPPPAMSWAHINWKFCKAACGDGIPGISDEVCPVRADGFCWCCIERICRLETPPSPQDYFRNFNIMKNQIIELQRGYLLIIGSLSLVGMISIICCIKWKFMKKKRYQKIVHVDDSEEEEQEKLKV